MRRNFKPCAAFSLVEISLAIGLMVFCVTALLGLMSVGLNSNHTSTEQTAATGLARMIYADLSAATPLVSGTSPRFQFVIPAAGAQPTWPNTVFFFEDGNSTTAGQSVSTGTSAPRYRASVQLTPPSMGSRAATAVRILITWPAIADPDPTVAPLKFAGSCEMITTLDRN